MRKQDFFFPGNKGRHHFGRPTRRWEDNIKIDLKEIGCDYVDCIYLAQNKGR